MNLYRY